ncbi:hypothetical protein [Pseudomonas sp. BRM28]|uniref:RCC1 domain-containing protein n=1 Tax=Pseudomonas sp. BRM28 TaxID=2045201 RepID=UPI0011AFDF03|nr:hypothetical protein [Pseudomonas sp. BRM28]
MRLVHFAFESFPAHSPVHTFRASWIGENFMTNNLIVPGTQSGLQTMIDLFNAIVGGPPAFGGFAAGTLALRRIYIPGYITPVYTEGAQVGVNKGMVNSVRGMQVFVQPYPNMLAGDLIEVFYGTSNIAAVKVSVREEQLGQNIETYIPAKKVLEGVHDLYYVITRAGSTNKESSLVLKVLARLKYPGGNDPEPDRAGHYKLLPPFLTSPPIGGVVGEEDIKDFLDGELYGVEVTVPAYPNMREYDTIRLSWGGSIVEYIVQPDEVGNDLVIEVDAELIYEAGDSEKLVLVYWIWDEVFNPASDWSLRGYIEVSIDPNKLLPPIIVNPDSQAVEGDPIDVALVAQDGLEVQVAALSVFGFKARDEITLYWVGTTAQGQIIALKYSQTLSSPRILVFKIPYAHVQMLARGFGRTWFTRKPVNGKEQTSRRVGANFIGAAVKLPSPQVTEAVDGVLEATLATATVVVPAAAQLEKDDFIEITWRGTGSDGSMLLYKDTKTVTSASAGKDISFAVNGPQNIQPLSGGSLEVSYTVSRQGLGRPLESQALTLQVGVAQLELPAPRCPQAQDGELDPDVLASVDVIIEPYTGMKLDQTIRVVWSDAGGTFFEDLMKVTKNNLDKQVTFTFEHAKWSNYLTVAADVYYQVIEDRQPTRVSAMLSLRRKERQLLLPDPVVEGAVNGTLRPVGDAVVTIPAEAQLKLGDEVELLWDGDAPQGSTSVTLYILEDQTRELKQSIDARFVLANIDANVRVKYVVYRFDGREQTSGTVTLRVQRAALPLPIFVQATANNQLNPDDVRNGATYRIDTVARLLRGDRVTVRVYSELPAGNFNRTIVVTAGDEGKALDVSVPYATINASNRTTIKLEYTLQRSSGGPEERSPSNSYFVNRVIGSGNLRIFGARYGASTYRASSTSRILSAFNAQSLQPILAEWRYLDEPTWTAGTTWMDKQPWKALRVRTQTDEVQLNPANIIGNGIDAAVNGSAAFVALRNERSGGERDIVGWGSIAYGAAIPPTLQTRDDIAEVSCTRSAYAARMTNGTVQCWGQAGEGGSMPKGETGNFVEVRSNARAFVGRKADGRLIAWGVGPEGATIPPGILNLTDFTAVYGAGSAFAAQRADGSLVAWGSAANGGSLPNDIADLKDIYYVKGNFAAFAARRTNNRVVAWGNAGYGGTVPDAIAQLTDIVTLEGATAQAFSALRATGQVVAWGAGSHGGSVPQEIAGLTDIVEVTSTWHAFCARRRNGSVVAWGNANNGGNVPQPVANLRNVIQVTGSAWAFAALCSDGTVAVWGRSEAGGDISRVSDQLKHVRAVYANSNGFAALTSDGRVVTWGQPQGGGDSAAVQAALRNKVTTGHRVDVNAEADGEWAGAPGA